MGLVESWFPETKILKLYNKEGDIPSLQDLKDIQGTQANLEQFLEKQKTKRTVVLDTHEVFFDASKPGKTLFFKDSMPINERVNNLLQFQSGASNHLFVQGKQWKHLYFDSVDYCLMGDPRDLDYATSACGGAQFSKLTR